jgi:hypothetical protein
MFMPCVGGVFDLVPNAGAVAHHQPQAHLGDVARDQRHAPEHRRVRQDQVAVEGVVGLKGALESLPDDRQPARAIGQEAVQARGHRRLFDAPDLKSEDLHSAAISLVRRFSRQRLSGGLPAFAL